MKAKIQNLKSEYNSLEIKFRPNKNSLNFDILGNMN
jgi:hypothetical protein